MKWNEEEHPRGQPENAGQFVEKGEQSGRDTGKGKSWRQGTKYGEILSSDKYIDLSPQEYAVLRAEVMRKNAVQKGKIKPTNFAYTANNFYIYSTSGGEEFAVLQRFDIEKDREKINYWLIYCGGKHV